jgi:hypothetical protein
MVPVLVAALRYAAHSDCAPDLSRNAGSATRASRTSTGFCVRPGKRVPQTPTSPGRQHGRSASLGCTVESGKKSTSHEVDGDERLETLVGNPVPALDETVLRRLRDAIAAEDVDEAQLKGVLRMLGEAIPEEHQLSLFGTKPDG